VRPPRGALVIGGSGTVGRVVVEKLARTGVPIWFTYHAGEAVAYELAEITGAKALSLDLTKRGAVRDLFAQVDRAGGTVDVLVHAAAVNTGQSFLDLTPEEWERLTAVNLTGALAACQELGRRTPEGGEADVVLVGALDRTQSLPIPAPFATTQGALGALAMSAAKELGSRGVRVNMVALGPLEQGLSQTLAPAVLEDFRAYSALRRVGTANEAADAIVWLALENTYMNGKVLPVNGGV